jgi:glycosyltransferase involved in cell wall biosynthesis
MTRIAYLVSHPIQYQAPLLRRLAQEKDLDFVALFLSDFSTRPYRDHGFQRSIAWDVDLLEGYQSRVLRAWGRRDSVGFWKPFTIDVEGELRRGGYDALWLHGYAHHAQLRAVLAAKRLGMKVLLRGESHATTSRLSGVARTVKDTLLSQLFTHVDAFLAIGTANREHYLSLGVPAAKIFLTPYAVDNARFQAASTAERGNEVRQSLGLSDSRAVILCASKLQPIKRVWDLWKAYEKLSPNGVDEPSPYLVFVGDGEHRADLEAAVERRGWNSVRFAGFQNQTQMPAYYASCDVYVLCSQRETWGLAVNEAMNAGKAVIVTEHVGGAKDLVDEGGNGYVVPVGDVDALSDRLKRITGDRSLAKQMGANSLRRISRWDFDADVEGLRQALAACGLGAIERAIA